MVASGSPFGSFENGRKTPPRHCRAVVVGMSAHAEVPVPLSYLQLREIELVGTFRYANTYPTAITLAASGQVDLDSLVSGYYGLAQVEEALDVGHRDPQAVKVVVRPGS